METTHLAFFGKAYGHMYILTSTYWYGLVFYLGDSCVEFVKSSPPIFYNLRCDGSKIRAFLFGIFNMSNFVS